MEHPRLMAVASLVLLAIAIVAYAQGGSGTELKPGDPVRLTLSEEDGERFVYLTMPKR